MALEFTIESRQGLQGEPLLSIVVPESQIDEKALYTIESDWPGFLVPFQRRQIDDKVEFLYMPQKRLNLMFFAGTRAREDYISLWKRLIEPLVQCEDWFMHVNGFVLDLQYLYLDTSKGREAISYLYLPVKQAGYDAIALQRLLQQVAAQFKTDDSDLTVRVLQSFLQVQGFQPSEFLQMLSSCANTGASVHSERPPEAVFSAPQPEQPYHAAEPVQKAPAAAVVAAERKVAPKQSSAAPSDDDFDAMDWDDEPASPRAQKPKKEKVRAEKPKKDWRGLFGKKEKQPARAESAVRGGAQLAEFTPQQPAQPVSAGMAQVIWQPEADADGVTQLAVHGTRLRYSGTMNYPPEIALTVRENGVFRIGRYDVSVGKLQSDFEFPADTPAVSRRHAAIMLRAGSYSIVDLNSRAGTFVNGAKLTPNAQTALHDGDRVSFGNAGANYILEVQAEG